jgi:hypothetical protein
MKAKHTPAPWLIEGNTVYALTHDGWRKGVEMMKNRFSASISIDRDFDEKELQSNARLIAAAPELLEALQLIASCEVRVKGDVIDIARKVLAKTLGEQL